ncbi:hypothetical protein [Bacillus sp. CH_442]|uniref:hypothetical protein n=1 Tax=Bacillus sp. CH_442 TaxID=2978217 RepID=UPI0030F95313|nr:hypothetical protein [Bacillus thuringiensis]
MEFITTGKTQVKSVKCCVLFDPMNGAIHHLHRVINMEGADEPSEHIIEQRTLQLAKQLKVDIERLQILHVDPRSIEPNKQYSVDLSNRRLMEVQNIKK